MNDAPILIVDDDEDDLDFIKQALEELKVENEILFFSNGLKFLEYMRTTERPTFFILCDMNLEGINGLELKRLIYEDSRLRLKCIPFILLSSAMKTSVAIMDAYSYGVQGYFVKPSSIKEYSDILNAIILYWRYSQHPNSKYKVQHS